MKKTLGKGERFTSSASFYNATSSEATNNLNFALVPGPVNLAVCTSTNEAILLPTMKSCMFTKSCTTGFAVSLWAHPPPKQFLSSQDVVIINAGILKLLYGSSLCNTTLASAYMVEVEDGFQVCTWSFGSNCTSSQAWTHLIVSFDSVNKNLLVIESGEMKKGQKHSCKAPSVLSDPVIGGTARHTCVDEIVFWDIPLKTNIAMKIACTLSHCGEYWAKKHSANFMNDQITSHRKMFK